MEFCYQSWNLINFAPELYQICMFFATTKKLSNDIDSPHFLIFSTKHPKCKINKRDGHGKVMDKYFVKSVGRLKCHKNHALTPMIHHSQILLGPSDLPSLKFEFIYLLMLLSQYQLNMAFTIRNISDLFPFCLPKLGDITAPNVWQHNIRHYVSHNYISE